jgi:ethanolamine permease
MSDLTKDEGKLDRTLGPFMLWGLGALSLYVISMCAFFKLRVTEPDLERPFKVFAYPIVPALALIIASVSLVAMSYYNQGLALLFFGIMFASSLIFTCFHKEIK